MKYNNSNLKRYLLFVTSLASFVAVPAMAAILVQNFMTFDMVVAEPPIDKVAGADAALSDFLTVDVGNTVSNGDTANSEVLLSNETITFTCFQGDRVYYTDVIQLVNTTPAVGGEDWNVNLTIEDTIAGDDITSDVSTSAGNDENADVWVFASNTDSTTALTETPNPNSASLTEWHDGTGSVSPLQVELTGDGTTSATNIVTGSTGNFLIEAGQQRQIALVADCDNNIETGDTLQFNITVESTPA